MRDTTTILLAKYHAPEKKESFYAKKKVSPFVNFEVGRLKKNKKEEKENDDDDDDDKLQSGGAVFRIYHYIRVFYIL